MSAGTTTLDRNDREASETGGKAGRGVGVPPTDIRNPDYFHKVVDCQWACPAHTHATGF